MEVDTSQAGGGAEEADVDSCDAEQAFDDNVAHGEHAFLPATCHPEAHLPLCTCGRSGAATLRHVRMCVLAQVEAQGDVVCGFERIRAHALEVVVMCTPTP
jgi:hypothetical protein